MSELIEVRKEAEGRGLGFKHAEDKRDLQYKMKPLVEMTKESVEEERTFKYYFDWSLFLDQGNTPMCVGYAGMNLVEMGSITQPKKRIGSPPLVGPAWLYYEAQKVDAWPGTSYDGTSVRAGLKVLQRAGIIESYYWAFDVETVIGALLYQGPLWIGVPWYSGMMATDENGVVKPTGSMVGGHSVVLNGINTKTEMLRFKNSWGKSWGRKSRGYISFEDFEKLMNEWSEVALPIENEMPEGTKPFTLV